jgi:hypothetical protein
MQDLEFSKRQHEIKSVISIKLNLFIYKCSMQSSSTDTVPSNIKIFNVAIMSKPYKSLNISFCIEHIAICVK